MKMHTNRKDTRFGAQLPCKTTKGCGFDCAVFAGRLQDFYRKNCAICLIFNRAGIEFRVK